MREVVTALPEIGSLLSLSQSLAILDAIISPEREDRYYSFDSNWGKEQMMASMRNGEGDDYFILFSSVGAIIKGFAHETPMSPYADNPVKVWNGVLDSIPLEFEDFLSEPAFSLENTTFCIWRKCSDFAWQIGEIDYPDGRDPDGMDELLGILDSKPSTYKKWADEYFETDISFSAVEYIYDQKPLSDDVVKKLNNEISIYELEEDIKEIRYLI